MKNGAHDPAEPIAIVGSGCRFPGGCSSPSKLWDLLRHPVDLRAEIPSTRFNPKGFYHANGEHPGTTNVANAYLIDEDPWAFDNDFFSISAKEAESMDPQQRIILETVYESIESAGYTISQLKGSSTGVFMGQMTDDYRDLVLRDLDCHPRYAATGTSRSILANRVSYVFDWRGPSLNTDTACSSSLVALHQAVQALRSGECEMAVVAGVNLVFGPEMFSFLSSLNMLSPNGRSRMWDISADGYARGEGFAAVVIKTLGKAELDGDDIESVIRNTGVNQDGRSAGLTVPSGPAQAALIRSTYERCGLDCLRKEDQCQYFEAHGTGTPAGDPKEAEGICSAFFPPQADDAHTRKSKLYVGSIKTVIGHLEGAAGLASLLKASLAVRHGLIPPNLHFNQLNPAIKPFYDRLQVPQRLETWPSLPPGVPRRASVNSFGFGGTNAHAIVESYESTSALPSRHSSSSRSSSPSYGPFVLSANSENALASTITSLSTSIKTHSYDLSRLAWTLQTKRSHLSHRAFFSATSKDELITSLNSAREKATPQSPLATRPKKVPSPRILGVFTGQGAQWASMGAELYRRSASFRKTIQSLEAVLEEAPLSPTWSLSKELLQTEDPTRMASAEMAQPLCTALQVALVDLLRQSGITFDAVVGHSSGEIGAAYAAGVIGARDAILIAYYRGYHCHRSEHKTLNPGRMMAVSMAPRDAEEFCRQPQFAGRICVAAQNSPSSVTLSGDAKGIAQAKVVLDDRKVFARVLKVDTAYHSHHMQSVREPYLASLRAARIAPRRNCFGGSCKWYTSVYGPDNSRAMDESIPFADTYWADNMTNAVLFSHAVSSAMENESFDLALEVGPHPALRGPATENMREVLGGNSLPYTGALKRNEDDVKSFSDALGFLWANVDSSSPLVDFSGFRRACEGSDWVRPKVLKGLPSYPWDHDKPLVKEPRSSKAWRTRSTPRHPLLGASTSRGSGSSREVRWRNVLRIDDLEWLPGHKFQNQILLPAAGYLVMAVDAARHLVGTDQPVEMVELQDVDIQNGVTLGEGSLGVDIDFSIKVIDETPAGATAEYSCRCSNADASSPAYDKVVFVGRVFVKYGLPVQDTLPSRVTPVLPMTDVDTERFYEWIRKVDLQYSPPFVLETIKRRMNFATVTTKRIADPDFTIHPGTLDSILQSLFVAFSYPGDGRMWTTYLPKSFRSLRFALHETVQPPTSADADQRLVADCYLTDSSARTMEGDLHVFAKEDGPAAIQAEGIVFTSLEAPTPANDRKMFYKTIWRSDFLSTVESPSQDTLSQAPSAEAIRLHDTCEKTARVYLSQLCRDVERQPSANAQLQIRRLTDWAREHIGSITDSNIELQLPQQEPEFKGQVDLELIHSLGSKLQSIINGSGPIQSILHQDDMLEQLHTTGLGVPQVHAHIGSLLESLVHQYPHMRILEVGAGAGATTSVALRHIGSKLQDYTFTDPLRTSLSAAQARFAKSDGVINYQILDLEQAPAEQGFQANSYDLVIAAHALHATSSVSQAIQHCRTLLRPGGFLLLCEPTNPTTLRNHLLSMGKSQSWFHREDDSARGPAVTEAQWDKILRDHSFSGVDRTLRDFEDDAMHSFSVMVSQAMDDRVSFLREPLNQISTVPVIDNLVIIGGHALAVSRLAGKVQSLLRPFAKRVTVLNSIEDVLDSGLTYGSAVVNLSGIEEAAFAKIDQLRVSGIQTLFREANYILWATRGSQLEDPDANIIVGIGRSVSREMAHLRLKFVDVGRHFQPTKHSPEATIFSEMLLQMIHLDQSGNDDILWSNENEVAVENGIIQIPRVLPDDEQDDSINSTRRSITRSVSCASTAVMLRATDEGVGFEELPSLPEDANSQSLQVLSSSLFSFTCSDDQEPFYLALGHLPETNRQVLAITKSNGSVLAVNPDGLIDCAAGGKTDQILPAIMAMALYESVFFEVSGTVWVHDADESAAELLGHIAIHHRDVTVMHTSSHRDSSMVSAGTATFVHPRTTVRELKALMPHNVRRFINMGSDQDSLRAFAASITGCSLSFQELMTRPVDVTSVVSLPYSRAGLRDVLESSVRQMQDIERLAPDCTIKADRIHELQNTAVAASVISWTGVESVQLSAAPASSRPLFADQKTYFLVGLTGDVGFSLCEWMINCGAKYIAIGSRKPSVPAAMLAHFEKMGATVRVFAVDLADMASLQASHKEIVSSMPPIAGVANAALVVRDHPFDSMTVQDIKDVFGPKVVGTKNLDKLFYSTPLDFFILFSSIAGIVGKPAQSNYNATCLFMSSMAAKRRQRGLAASVMHFGMLLGFGFIHGQAGPTTEARFRQDDFMAIPEPHYHEIFAQAVLSGRPDSGSASDVIAGLGSEIDTPWRALPRFSHCRFEGEDTRAGDKRSDKKLSVKDQLEEASDSEAALSVLRSTIAGRVSMALGSPDENLDDSVGLVTLGLDSLVAVEIRSWLLKVLEVDVPTLQFLNGSSLLDICNDVLSKLPPALTSWESKGKPKGSEERKEKKPLVNGVSPQAKITDSRTSSANGAAVNGLHKTTHELNQPEPSEKVTSQKPLTNGYHTPELPSRTPTTYARVGAMSHAQAQLYFLHEYLQNNAHNIAYNGIVHGRLDIERLRTALWVVGKRHEALRSAYFMDSSTSSPVQAVMDEPRIILEHRNISHRRELQAEIDAVKDFAFEIERGFVLKVTVLSYSPSQSFIVFNHHHIAIDGVGWNVFVSELSQAYAGRVSSLPPASNILQSIDMAQRQRDMVDTSPHMQSDLEFWKATFQSIPEPLPLFSFATAKTRPATKDYRINTANMRLSGQVTKFIEKAASKVGVTPFQFYLASLATFLARCLGIDDVSIGVVDSNRTKTEEMQTIGYFLNMVPVRVMLEQSESFDAVARRVRDHVLVASTHQSTPFDMILDHLKVSRSTAHHPLFQAAINHRRATLNETSFGPDGKIEWEGGVPGGNPYDIFLNIVSSSDWTLLQFITQASLYEESDGALMLKWYARALEALAHDSKCEIGLCPIANESDIEEATKLGRGAETEMLWKGTLVDRIVDMAKGLFQEAAIKDDLGATLTYGQMMARVNGIMQQLQTISPQLGPGSRVAMLLDPEADAICCILAILRLGFVWIPLDPLNHQRRLRAVVKESRPQVLLCHGATKAQAEELSEGLHATTLLPLDRVDGNLLVSEVLAPGPDDMSDRLKEPAMIIYTSGSTGLPKGVVLTHEGLTNQIFGTTVTLNLRRETTLQQSPLGFDLMIDQIFLALCNGGTVAVVGRAGRGDPTHIAELMVKHSVTLTHFVPSEYLALLNYGHHILTKAFSWRYAMSGGEYLGGEARKAFRKLGLKNLDLVNVYGPAEISVACAKGIVPYRETTSTTSDYLRPSPNYRLQINDAQMNALPVGFPGEICISGRGVGLGYLDRPEETRRKFTSRTSFDKSALPIRTYRSGDKGRILPDGTLRVLGRLDGDSQVKIHGFRVELDEIANALVQVSNGTIMNAAASWRPGQASGAGLLVAFIVFDANYTGDKAAFVEWLGANYPLPSVMKPTYIVPTERIPATPNGKIDRAAVDALLIPDPVHSDTNGTAAEKLSPSARAMKEVWEEVLSVRNTRGQQQHASIRSSSDFFQVGGNSLLMIKLRSLIEIQFGVKISLPELFHASTLGRMAACLETAVNSNQETDSTDTEEPSSFFTSKAGQQTINWDLEMASLIDGLPQPNSAPSLPNGSVNGHSGLIVVLTGATGFVGKHLLSHLVRNPRIAQVHCIAIRPDAAGNPRHVPVKSDKIVEYSGELSDLSLGLSDAQFMWLAKHADAVIHNGAEVSLLKSYPTLRRANVVSTRTLCEMTIPRRLPVHFVSTASVAKVMKLEGGQPLREVAPSPAVPELLNTVDGYAASKWASETLMENLAVSHGLSGFVHRLAHVVGEDASELDAVGMLTKYSLLMRKMPWINPDDVTGQWDFITVEDVARDMTQSVIDSADGLGSTVRHTSQTTQHAVFMNYCSDEKVSHQQLQNYLEEMAGERLQEIGMKEWLQGAQEHGMHPLVHEFFKVFDEGRGKMVLPVIAKDV